MPRTEHSSGESSKKHHDVSEIPDVSTIEEISEYVELEDEYEHMRKNSNPNAMMTQKIYCKPSDLDSHKRRHSDVTKLPIRRLKHVSFGKNDGNVA